MRHSTIETTPVGNGADGARGVSLPDLLTIAVAVVYTSYLLYYYTSGGSGPTELAVQMVPASLALLYLNDLRSGAFYPMLGFRLQNAVATIYIVIAFAAAIYLSREFDAVRIARMGAWNIWDHIAGGAVVVLILEYTRCKYLSVFIVNLILISYGVYGFLIPGLFHHPGLSWTRMSSALSLEMSTGIFERLPQLGLTLIGSFLLLLAALQAFGCIDSILRASSRLAARSPRLLPQAAVVGSFGVAAVSGSGAANAAATGAATIPMLIKAGFPRAYAAAVETASSLGGQLMPPLMGISAFLMADLMGVGYYDVVARGFAPAIIYFMSVALAVYLLTVRFHPKSVRIDELRLNWQDLCRIAAYLTSILALIWTMGYLRMPAMVAAQRVFLVLSLFLSSVFLMTYWKSGTSNWRQGSRPFVQFFRNFSTTTAELTILLASLGILTATFTATGVPDKLGVLLMQLAQFNIVAMVLAAFAFGYLIGTGLPVAPTYIVLAVVTTPFLLRAGIDPWVSHFFAFFVAIFGELSPPTSVTAAVTSRIAGASFLQTMWHAMGICLPLLTMMAAIFSRPGLVAEPGFGQLGAFILVLVGTLGLVFSLHGRFDGLCRCATNRLIRLLNGAGSLVILFHPSLVLASVLAIPVAVLITVGVLANRQSMRS